VLASFIARPFFIFWESLAPDEMILLDDHWRIIAAVEALFVEHCDGERPHCVAAWRPHDLMGAPGASGEISPWDSI
jgi:hypothetical protein